LDTRVINKTNVVYLEDINSKTNIYKYIIDEFENKENNKQKENDLNKDERQEINTNQQLNKDKCNEENEFKKDNTNTNIIKGKENISKINNEIIKEEVKNIIVKEEVIICNDNKNVKDIKHNKQDNENISEKDKAMNINTDNKEETTSPKTTLQSDSLSGKKDKRVQFDDQNDSKNKSQFSPDNDISPRSMSKEDLEFIGIYHSIITCIYLNS